MQNADRDLKNAETFSMTTMCNEFGVTLRALRFYEQRGLLAPQRCGEARAFTYRDRARLQLILRGKQFGFTDEGCAAEDAEPVEAPAARAVRPR